MYFYKFSHNYHDDKYERHQLTYLRPVKKGFTLIELMIVVAILSTIAMITMPQLSSTNPVKVTLAAEQVATALRFTRSEAIRTGIPHGMIVDHNNSDLSGKDVTVYQVDINGTPFNIDHIVYQPIKKQLYDITIPDIDNKINISLTNSAPAFAFDSIGSKQHIHFANTGQPIYYQNGQPYRLLSGNIMVGDGNVLKTVSISSINGRVTVQ